MKTLAIIATLAAVPALGQDVSSSPSMAPTPDYFRWGIHLEHGTFYANATAADDTKGLVITMNVYTAPDRNRTELELYQKNCSIAIDGDEGNLGALIISSSIQDTGRDVNGYDMQEITVEINSTILTDHAVWTDGLTDATGYAEICARTNLFHPGIDGGNTADDILVSFKEVEFRIDVDLTNNTYEINANAEAMDTEDAGVETLRDEYSVDACFCTGASNFDCDNPAPTLEQNGEVEVCLTPTSTDTEIFHFSLNIDQENNTSTMLPIRSVTNNGNGGQDTYPLTVITQSGDTKKVTAMVLGLFFDQFNTGVVTTLPPIEFNGTVDLNFHTVSRERRLIENAPIVWNVPSAGLRRAQEGNIFDQDPSNAATTDNGVAAQAEFGLSAQIKRATNKEGGNGGFETEVPDDVPSAAHVDDHEGIHRDSHATQSDTESAAVGSRSVLAGAMVTFAFLTM